MTKPPVCLYFTPSTNADGVSVLAHHVPKRYMAMEGKFACYRTGMRQCECRCTHTAYSGVTATAASFHADTVAGSRVGDEVESKNKLHGR